MRFPRLECRTDATHVIRCVLGTGVRLLNWALAASAGFSVLCLVAGISRSAIVCRLLEVSGAAGAVDNNAVFPPAGMMLAWLMPTT